MGELFLLLLLVAALHHVTKKLVVLQIRVQQCGLCGHISR
jgi:hypothetical protein